MDWINSIVQGVLLGGLYALFAAGLSLIFGVMRLVNIAHGDFIVLAAYLGLTVTTTVGLHPLVALIIVIPVMGLIGYVLQRGVLNHTLGDDILPPLLVTFGLSVILQNGLLEIYSADPQKMNAGALETASLTLPGNLNIGWLPLLMFAVSVATIAGLQWLFYRSALGRAFRATSDNQDIAQLMGLNKAHVFGLAMALSLAVVAIAGLFLGIRTSFDPSAGPGRLIFGFEAVIIGGLGNLWGTLAGGINPKGVAFYHSLIDELRANGLTLVKEIECKRLGAYGMLVRSESTVYVVFRGSANVKNLATDLQYHVSSQETMDDWADEAGMHMPQGLQVHSGFLEVWRSLRAELMDAFEELCAEERRLRKEDRKDLRLVVSGHSMGGAIAMFAALELASRLAKRESHPFGDGQLTYTFGAPRIGNAKFAKLVHHAFPKPNQPWALQRSNDAVPHLPFFSWGFRHPHGVAFLDPVTDKNMKPTDYVKEEPPPGSKEFDLWARQQEGAPTAIARSGDRGDDMIKLRPFGGKALKWASYHHIFAYLEPLQALLHVHYESEECQQEGEYPEHCPIFAA